MHASNICTRLQILPISTVEEAQNAISSAMGEYLLFSAPNFGLAYDSALIDALAIAEGNDVTCFRTIFEPDCQNNYQPNSVNPLKNPSLASILSHPSDYITCIFRKEALASINHEGNTVYEIIIKALLQLIINAGKCYFSPLGILTTSLRSSGVDKNINIPSLKEWFYKKYPIAAPDYKYLLQKKDADSDEEDIVLSKIKKTAIFRTILSFRKVLDKIGFYKAKANYRKRQYIRRMRKEDAARIAEIGRKIESLPANMLHPKNDNTDIIVSLTTHGKRFIESAPYAIYSIFEQTVLPARIVISVDKEDWNEGNLPPMIKKLQKSGLEVLFCRDVRSHTKLLPALAKFPDNPIITIDDDMFYEPHMIEELVTAYKNSDKKTIFCRQASFPRKKEGKYIPYMQWDDSSMYRGADVEKLSAQASPLGVSGVLYPPHIFDEEIFNDSVFLKLAPHTDDIWFWVMELRCGVTAQVIENSKRKDDFSISMIEYLVEDESTALYFQNCFNGRNDEEMNNLLSYYSLP